MEKGFDYVKISYKQLMEGRFPAIKTKKVIIFLFFPFYYWNRYIEHKHYKGVYGNLGFFKKFIRFCERLDRIIRKALSDKEIFFINNPLSSALYRDKIAVKKKLTKAGVTNPKLYNPMHIKELQDRLVKGHNFFLKPRCGSMGKGITFLSWPEWQTNFLFKKGKIISKKSDKGWKFRSITGNTRFLRQLLSKDIFIEEAVDMLVLDKKKLDLRVYTFFKKSFYVYPRKNHPDKVTTNISQGGKGDPALVEILPKHLLAKAKKIAEKTSRVLGFDLAGVDVVLDRNLKDVYIVDVNAFPGFPKRKTFNVTRYIIKELIRLSNNGALHFEKACDI